VFQNNGQAPLAVRSGDWVLIQKGAGPGQQQPQLGAPAFELFNLATDLGQTNNLAGAHPEKVKELAQQLETLKTSGRSRP
jgi:arylsulfatase A-like enzyme